jgi:hypothetical protein
VSPIRDLQPFLHDATVVLRAPAQVWSRADGGFASAIDGVYVSDVRVLQGLNVAVGGEPGEHIATLEDSASTVRFVSLHRALDAAGADPDVRGTLTRRVTGAGVGHEFEVASRLPHAIMTDVTVDLVPDVTAMESIKSGARGISDLEVTVGDGGVRWRRGPVTAELRADAAEISADGGAIRLAWRLELPAHGSASVWFELAAVDRDAVVAAAPSPAPWRPPSIARVDDRLARWVDRALDDLDALRLVTLHAGDQQFLAAGAPWFFTLFGRDALWAARLMLPLGTDLAASTLRALAAFQGRERVAETAEQPGKIMHELRRGTAEHAEGGMVLPPLYYGTVDATPLWVCLLADARDAGLRDDDILPLLPHLEAALAWMRDDGDSDGDGLLEYVDETGRGLSNQGWKDSGDSIQWRDGRLADGPIALCEVQAYAYEAAIRGGAILRDFGLGGDEWPRWAARLSARFRETFWIPDAAGAYPAIALDAEKRPVDTVTSNLGHLLGTGLLAAPERVLVARRLVSPELDSGFGLRTMSTDSAGYWPLSYHGGSVWAHDTAIAIRGLARDGFRDEAATLAEGLLRAAVAFDYRMPELHGGDSAAEVSRPVPYPAACRPQAWSAAAAIAVLDALR